MSREDGANQISKMQNRSRETIGLKKRRAGLGRHGSGEWNDH